jgi:hypothetical protein
MLNVAPDAVNEDDLNQEIKDIITSGSNLPPDLRVDDRDLKLAPNIWEFLMNPYWIGSANGPFPYAQQMRIGIQLYADYNPLVSDNDFFEYMEVDTPLDEILDHIVLLHHGQCPKTYVGRAELIREGHLNDYRQLVAVIGQRSGKSEMSGWFGAYTTQQFMKLPDPGRVFGLMPGAQLVHTVTANTFDQALMYPWAPLLKIFNSIENWFHKYHELLDHYGKRYGEELYTVKNEIIRYRHRGLLLFPASPNSNVLRGASRYCATVDEIAHMGAIYQSSRSKKNNTILANPRETYNALDASLLTLRGAQFKLRQQGWDNIPVPMMFCISSPRSQLDEVMHLWRLSINSKTSFGIKKATWEVNPNLPRNSPDIEKAFNEDALAAAANFGANPPMGSNPFIEKIDFLAASVDKSRSNAVTINIKQIKTASGVPYLSGTPTFEWRDRSVDKLMAIDGGFNNNSFALAIGHNTPDLQQHVVDAQIEIIPQEGLPINHASVLEDLIFPIIKELNVTMVVCDRWESLMLLSRIENELGIATERYSVKYIDFSSFRNSIFQGWIKTPKSEIRPVSLDKEGKRVDNLLNMANDNYPFVFKDKPCAHYLLQCITVRDLPNQTVTKGDNTTDDIFRATVLLHSYLSDEEYKKKFSGLGRARSVRGIGSVVRIGEAKFNGRSRIGSLISSAISSPGGRNNNGVYTMGKKKS